MSNRPKAPTPEADEVRVAFKILDDFATKSLPPELHDKWCELVGHWSNFSTSLSGVQKAGRHF